MDPQPFDLIRRSLFLLFGLSSLAAAAWHWRGLFLLKRLLAKKSSLDEPIGIARSTSPVVWYREKSLWPIAGLYLVMLLLSLEPPDLSQLLFALFNAVVYCLIFGFIYKYLKDDPIFFPRRVETFRTLRKRRRLGLLLFAGSAPVLIVMAVRPVYLFPHGTTWQSWAFLIPELLALPLGYLSFAYLLYPGWKRAFPFSGNQPAVATVAQVS